MLPILIFLEDMNSFVQLFSDAAGCQALGWSHNKVNILAIFKISLFLLVEQ